jgi:hypothetical protein
MLSRELGGGQVRELLRRLTRRPIRASALAGTAFVVALVLASAYWNVADLVVLQDHPLPASVFWPALWVLIAGAMTLLIPSSRRSRAATTLVFGATGLVLVCGAGVGFAVAFLGGGGPFDTRGQLVDSVSSAGGRYQVQVFNWQSVLGEDGWDVVIQRRDGLRYVEAYAGCLFSEGSARYERIQAVEAGSVLIATDESPISIAFDPETMHVTRPIPVGLCQGYE